MSRALLAWVSSRVVLPRVRSELDVERQMHLPSLHVVPATRSSHVTQYWPVHESQAGTTVESLSLRQRSLLQKLIAGRVQYEQYMVSSSGEPAHPYPVSSQASESTSGPQTAIVQSTHK